MAGRRVRWGADEVRLTPKEFDLLQYTHASREGFVHQAQSAHVGEESRNLRGGSGRGGNHDPVPVWDKAERLIPRSFTNLKLLFAALGVDAQPRLWLDADTANEM
jgi:hypothetical protein